MDIRPLDPDDPGAMKHAVELINSVESFDAPWRHPDTLRTLDAEIRYGWDLEPGQHFLGWEDGLPVAYGVLELSERDNLDLAWFTLSVPPDLRRQGRGTAMLRFLEDAALAAGRSKAGAYAWDGSAGRDFAEHHGYRLVFRSINRRQHLAEVSGARVRELYDAAAAAAADYELIRIEGRSPEDLLEPMAGMVAAINDAPTDDLDVEDEAFSADRVAAYETAQLRGGKHLYRLVARHVATGELAGNSVVAVEVERPWIGHQQDTSVVRDHRGHRLGMLLKSGMLLWLAEVQPQLRSVDTFNAESNGHMIAVNEDLDYRWMGRGLGFQRPLAD